ncbi:MAG: uncharacterized protein KVP18_003792 [Porospora cf. gigantea A]|uniref:uncharacterized protein n=1 Tax=Porospora cf. gigantea A TaxID=2853593 RepID=UPI003559E656|nr:MAG: hypothetical protein KVP18_003792 [Porospora cf. gigantea A]
MHFACMKAKLEVVRLLHNTNSSLVHAVDKTNAGSLHFAARRGDCKAVVEFLVLAGADVRALDDDCTSWLHAVVENGNLVEVLNVVSPETLDLSIVSRTKGSLLQWALVCNDESAVRLLMANNATTAFAAALPAPLIISVAQRNHVLTDLLLAAMSVADIEGQTDPEGYNALHVAAENEDLDMIRKLLAAAPGLARYSVKGKQPIDYVSKDIMSTVADAWRKAGADRITVESTSQSPVSSPQPETATTDSPHVDLVNRYIAEFSREAASEVFIDPNWEEKKLRATTELQAERFSEAYQMYRQLLEDVPNSQSTQPLRQTLCSNLCHVSVKMQRSEAIDWACQTIALNPSWWKGHYRLAQVYRLLGDHDEYCQALYQATLRDTESVVLRTELKKAIEAAKAARNAERSDLN